MVILACSDMMKQELIELYKVDAEKIKVLFPPIDSSKFNQSGKAKNAELRTKYGFAQNKKSLLFLTTGNERKGYPFLLELMETLKDEPIELVVAGVKPMNSSLPNVKYIGYAQKPEELLWATDALIHPALYEPFGQVITEAIQCGTPVLISDMVGAKSVVSDKEGRVVKGFDKKEWVLAVKETLKTTWNISPDFAVENRLTVEQHCQKILALGRE
jgi:glycosyltransferase involved in cell wall biosynthesis